jgi:pyrimidine-nucleoside phosphorylase
MHIIEIIQKKRDHQRLSKQEIDYLISNYVSGSIPDYQMAAFLMATCLNGMNDEETSWLTDAMLYSGEVITHNNRQTPIIDKHSTGGVGDKITIPLAPAIAACGLKVPSIAGRGLGHTGGTLDKLESIPGFRCNLSIAEYKNQVEKIGCVITGQTKEIAPADKLLYALRDVTGTVPSVPLISASIMSKKLAEGIDGLVLDVKFGSGAFMREVQQARTLAKAMVAIGSHMGKKVTACLTNMDQPLGDMLGNALEIVESIDILQGRGPKDSVELTVLLGAEMLLLGNQTKTLEEGRNLVKNALSSGAAFNKFVSMVKAQGGDERVLHEPKLLLTAKDCIVIEAPKSGFVEKLDCLAFGLAVGILGGGRCKLTDIINPAVGIKMHAKIGDKIELGQPLCTIYADGVGVLEAKSRIEAAITIANVPVDRPELCIDRITSN